MSGVKVEKLSASQVEEYSRCPRRWYNAYVLGHRQPPTEAMERGTKIHAEVEHYLTTGAVRPGDWARLVDAARPHLPEPAPEVQVEQWIEMPTWEGGPRFVGRYDAIDWRPREVNTVQSLLAESLRLLDKLEAGPPASQRLAQMFAKMNGAHPRLDAAAKGRIEAEVFLQRAEALARGEVPEVAHAARVVDCKTTSDFRYAKSPSELGENIQLNAYAVHVLREGPTKWWGGRELDAVALRHVYLRTRGAPKAMAVDVVVSARQVAERWRRTLELGREMVGWADAAPKSAEDLPPNTESCGLYGGCAYKPLCGFGGDASVFQIRKTNDKLEVTMPPTNEKQESLLERLRREAEEQKAKPKQDAAPAPASAPDPHPWVEAVCPSCQGTRMMPSPSGGVGAFVDCTTCKKLGWVKLASTEPVGPDKRAVRCMCGPPDERPASCLMNVAGLRHSPGTVCSEDRLSKLLMEQRERDARAGRTEAPAPIAAPAPTAPPHGASGIVPPDSPPRTNPPAEVAPAERPAAKGKKKPAAAAPEGMKIKVSDETGVYECVLDAAGQVLSRTKIGEAEAAPITTPTAAPATPTPVAATPTAKQADAPAPAPKPANGGPARRELAIYVRCLPVKGAHRAADQVVLEEWIAPIAEQVARDHRDRKGAPSPVLDWRLVEYGEGRGELAAAVRKAIPTLPPVVIVPSKSQVADVFLEAAIPHATSIVEGV